MVRMLGFMLFPREGAGGGAWSFLLSPVSAAVADLPLALFVFRSPLAIASLLLPITACFALTILCGTTFDRERLMETGLGRLRKRRVWIPMAVLRRNAAAIAAGVLIAAASAGVAVTTGAALPIYWSLVFGSGRRLDRLREAWAGYWTLFRGLVIPACALFGLVVFRLLAAG